MQQSTTFFAVRVMMHASQKTFERTCYHYYYAAFNVLVTAGMIIVAATATADTKLLLIQKM